MFEVADLFVQTPLNSLLSPPETPNLQSKLYLTDDPALVVLYKQLREKSLQTLRGALSISPRAEWDFVLHTAGLYTRMGCDLLALDLVRTWEFLTPPSPPPPASNKRSQAVGSPRNIPLRSPHSFEAPSALDGFDIDPRKILRRRSSLVVADLPATGHRRTSFGHDSAIQEEEKNGVDGSDGTNGFKTEQKKKRPPPTQFKEPDANSLLDSFGF